MSDRTLCEATPDLPDITSAQRMNNRSRSRGGISPRQTAKLKQLAESATMAAMNPEVFKLRAQVLGSRRRIDCACFLGSVKFAGFTVGNEFVGCYRSDVAINLMSGGFCRIRGRGGKVSCQIMCMISSGRTQGRPTQQDTGREKCWYCPERPVSEF